ncbi:17.8 kDa class I heat shock protein-like [Cucurbita moschata]|uniref:17.8 kDa class I heat shock protein-like n=2 Tax=Cucurbita TaxID=3660 RepID=A0A6J1E7D1_CUCMO
MEKGEASNVSYEEFEPFCKWKKLDDSDVHVLEVHLPEFKKEELRVRIKNNSILAISGEHLANDGKKMQFNREIKLPKDIYPDQIRAKFGGSVLSITMPKKPSSAESSKPKADAASEGNDTAPNDDGKPKNLISRLTSPLSRLKFSKKKATALAAAVVILAFGAYYLIKNRD